MMLKMKEKTIYCVIASILLFVGMCVETSVADSSFFRASESADTSITSVGYIAEDTDSFAMDMLGKSKFSIRSNIGKDTSRWQDRAAFLCVIVGAVLQYLLYYQSTECREDGQLLVCRSVTVNYIHQKDGEK